MHLHVGPKATAPPYFLVHQPASGLGLRFLTPQKNSSELRRASSSSASGEQGANLSALFSRHVNELEGRELLPARTPSPFMSPTAVVAAQMDALSMNDWPETDSGAQTAFAFTKPHGVESLIRGPAARREVRSWHGHEDWLPFSEFSNMLHSPPLQSLLNCSHWQAVSPLTFPSSTRETRAVQAVEISTAGPSPATDQQQLPTALWQDSSSHPALSPEPLQTPRKLTFTFCLERIDTGPYKGCWLTVGVRSGNYAG